MKLLLLILCFYASSYCVAFALSSDGLTLLSLLKHWISVPPSINSSWKASDSTPCSWLGVQCDHDSHVVSLNLTVSSIFGQLGSEIGNLNRLHTLELSKNGLSGTIPLELGNCSLLEHINLSNNSFSGHIPYSLKNLQNLQYLSFYSNQLTGGIPEFLFQIPHLQEVYLYYNNISGPIPSNIGNATELSKLYLSGNQLSGIIPSSIGEIPSLFGHLMMLQSLDVSQNNLTVPESLMKYLSSSPTSFLGIPGLCVSCPDLHLSRFHTNLKPCDNCKSKYESTNHKYESTNHKRISKFVILIVEVGSPMLVAIFLIKLIHKCLSDSDQISMEDVIGYNEEEQELWSLMEEHSLENGIIDLRCKGEVMKATENLDDRYIIGRGGQGTIYKAELDFGVFAVKKIVAKSKRKRLSMAREIKIIKKIRHQNVARFLGCWIGDDYGLIFLRYMENGSLHDILHENDPPHSLDCTVSYQIAVGVAKGLEYLHHGCDPPVLHRDISPKNILLDSDMEPYITDFGISIALNQPSTMQRMRSTYHLEIASTIVSSSESDVYSYGVVLLELMTGKKVLDSSFEEKETTLVGWFKSVWRETREIEEIVDSNLSRELSDLKVVVQVIKVLLVALICTQTDPGKRLKMRDVIKIFEAPTVQGIHIQNDRTSFHLGSALSTALSSIFMQARTVVIKGLPKDIKRRELPNLLRWFPGYEVSQLSLVHEKPIAYALFNTAQQAVAAKDSLQDLVFDAETKSVLRSQIADKQYFVKRVVMRENDVRSTDKGTNMRRKIQQNFNSSGAYDNVHGKGLCTAVDYPHIGYGSASPSSPNYLPSDVQGIFMASPSYHPYVSLHDVLHVRDPMLTLVWNVRYKIAVGIAHELAYLHHHCHPPILHHYINPKNIFLDFDMEPHICDFGVSRTWNQSSCAAGEPSTHACFPFTENGYMREEGVACDVYNYGVVLVELISGKKVLDLDPSFLKDTSLVEWVRCTWMETRDVDKIVDSRLAWELVDLNVEVQVTEVISVALLCTDKDPHQRPTMKTVIKLLGDDNYNEN
ncbi:receptor-like protein kinase [Senna tora]|uniref:non-specific serine/threonine protein kinase n=1 Tax=Senna tora TaxID=362788 RepID=A0A835CI38_9FABA|nr:receptor-like protein kinase [Senna tora]